MKFFPLIVLAVVSIFLPAKIWALDADVRTNGIVSLRYEGDHNFRVINPALKFTDESFFSLFAFPSLSADIGDYTTMTFSLFSGEVSRRTFDQNAQSHYSLQNIGDYSRNTYFIREAYIDVTNLDWLDISAGRQRVVVGSSFILDAYQPSLVVNFSPESTPVNVSASLVKVEPYKLFDPDRKSIVGEAEASYFFDPFESEGVTVFVTTLFDNDNFLAGLLNTMTTYQVYLLRNYPEFRKKFLSRVVEDFERFYGHKPDQWEMERIMEEFLSASAIRSSSGMVFWPGVRARKSFGDFTLSGSAIFEIGAPGLIIHHPVRINEPQQTSSINFITSSFLFDIHGTYEPTENLRIGGFFLFQRGESDNILKIVDDKSFSGFLAVSPFITYTNIFFNGGINENVSSGSLSAAGIFGLGVVTPGLTLGYSFTDDLDVNVTFAIINTESPPVHLGNEADLNLSYDLMENVSLVVEADRFSPALKGVEPIWRAAAGVDLTW